MAGPVQARPGADEARPEVPGQGMPHPEPSHPPHRHHHRQHSGSFQSLVLDRSLAEQLQVSEAACLVATRACLPGVQPYDMAAAAGDISCRWRLVQWWRLVLVMPWCVGGCLPCHGGGAGACHEVVGGWCVGHPCLPLPTPTPLHLYIPAPYIERFVGSWVYECIYTPAPLSLQGSPWSLVPGP